MKRWKWAAKIAGWVLGALASAVTLAVVITANSERLISWAVGSVAVTCLVFLVALLKPELVVWLERLRKYPELERLSNGYLDAFKIARQERDEAREQLLSIPADLQAARRAGHVEVVGSLLAIQSNARLIPVGSTFDSEVGLRVVAELDGEGGVPLRARFVAQSASVGTRKGILSVIEAEPEGKRVYLVVAETSNGSDGFWQTVKTDAESHEGAPRIEIVADQLVIEVIKGMEE